jgi:hypothetical protein
MSETLKFKVYCTEQYKTMHDLKGRDVIRLFKQYGVLDYLNEFYDVLHTYGYQYIVNDIDSFIQARKEKDKDEQ